jgi:hypothetical protein
MPKAMVELSWAIVFDAAEDMASVAGQLTHVKWRLKYRRP